ncbi:unnamed protein product [Linum trigynum]|uniref:Uncharacterized protein n=1 Tax=Linum trigynum TaxID=586398 RepID=A0AAV2CMX7_9ROSI
MIGFGMDLRGNTVRIHQDQDGFLKWGTKKVMEDVLHEVDWNHVDVCFHSYCHGMQSTYEVLVGPAESCKDFEAKD